MRPESDEDVLDALASDLRDALLDTEHQQGAANALDRVAACTDGQLAYFGMLTCDARSAAIGYVRPRCQVGNFSVR